jgi:hypothetical protein
MTGCDCAVCEKRRTRHKALKERYRAAVRAGEMEPPHGLTGYSYGCRCDECRDAQRLARLALNRRKGVRAARSFSADERAHACEIAASDGAAAAADQTGVARNTIYEWCREAGVTPYRRPPADHGTRARYVRGCRCESCTTANRENTYAFIRQQTERAQRGEIDIPHGEVRGYRYYGCRCERCTTANTVECQPYTKAYRERRRVAS